LLCLHLNKKTMFVQKIISATGTVAQCTASINQQIAAQETANGQRAQIQLTNITGTDATAAIICTITYEPKDTDPILLPTEPATTDATAADTKTGKTK
jgi:flagellar capping protein FliD